MKHRAMIAVAALTIACSGLSHSQPGIVKWSVLDGGFAIPSSTDTRVMSAAGQTFVGASTSANSSIRSGFLGYRIAPPLSTGILGNEKPEVPTTYGLSQNYPNPFNPTTTIQFSLPRTSTVRLAVYNVLGQEVVTLVDEVRDAGYYSVVWNGKNRNGSSVSSGVYFFRIGAQDISGQSSFSQLRKMILLK